MAVNKKISDLDTATGIDGSEMIPVVKNGNNFKVLISQIRDWIGVASTAAAGLMTAADKTKLSGIENNATANSTDAMLRDRSTHTGQQPASSIQGLKTVATSGAYADLTGKPDLTPAGLGVAPASHVGAGGDAHPIATVDTAGFMSPTTVALLAQVKQLAFTADYTDLLNRPINRVAPMGFTWWADSNTDKGSTINDYNSFGTGSYHPIAATGTKYRDAMEFHNFVSAADTYSIAGIRSAKPVAKIGRGSYQGGFKFEAIVHWTYAANTCMVIGLSDNETKAYGNFSGTDVGIAIGWNSGDTGASTLKVMVGNGTTVNRFDATAGALQDDASYYVSFEVKPADDGSRVAVVRVINLDTGVRIVDDLQIAETMLPPFATPLIAMVEYGTLANTTAVSVDLLAMTCERHRGF